MLIVEVNERQTIERALKVLKRKWDKTKTLKELRERKEFTPKSDIKRNQRKKAHYLELVIKNKI